MRKFIFFGLIFLSIGLLCSCFKDDERITPHQPGNFLNDTARLTDSYKYQVYYNLNLNQEVSSQLKTLWDLGFENSTSGWKVILNSSCFMKSAFLDGQTIGSAVDTTGAKWIFNPSDGSADSLAIGNWFKIIDNDTIGNNRLLLIDRGMDENGISRGYNQLVLDSLKNGVFYFRMAAYNGNNVKSYSVRKSGLQNYMLFSISKPDNLIVEPEQNNWDLLFTQYTTLLFTDAGDPYPYLVTGVILNKKGVEVAVDSVHYFNEITFGMAQELSFKSQSDEIGYSWKIYDFDAGTYAVKSNVNYIIKGVNGYLYKFRFLGFTNKKLEKGYISFEYQRL